MTEEALCSFSRRFGRVLCDLIGDTLITSTQLVDFRRYHGGQQRFRQAVGAHRYSLQRTKAEGSYEDAAVAKVGSSIDLGSPRLQMVRTVYRAMTHAHRFQETETSLKNAALQGGPHRLGHSSRDHSSRQFRNMQYVSKYYKSVSGHHTSCKYAGMRQLIVTIIHSHGACALPRKGYLTEAF